jgi:hypothetical protein
VEIAVTVGNQFGGGGPFATNSAANFLGTDDGDLFQSGDDFAISFAASNAIGMHVITVDPLLDDDIFVTVGRESAALIVADLQAP